MRTTAMLSISALLLFAAACGSDGDDSSQTETDSGDESATEEATPTESAAEESATEAATEAPADDSEASAPPPSGGGQATVTLANGESFQFEIFCALEPQMAAGSEILFTVVSNDEPGLDVTQFGDEGTVTGLGSITIWDGGFETLWEASTIMENFGGSFELTLSGSTVTGGGTFYKGADLDGETTEGELTANC